MPEDIQKLTRRRLGGILMAEGLVTPEQVTEALEKQKDTGNLLGEILVELGYITENNLVKILSMQFQLPFISPQNYEVSKEVLDLVPAELMYKYLFIPLDRFSNILTVAMGGLLEEDAIQAIKKETGCEVKVYIAPPSLVRKALQSLVGAEPVRVTERETVAELAEEEKPVVILQEMKTKKRTTTHIRKVTPPAKPPSPEKQEVVAPKPAEQEIPDESEAKYREAIRLNPKDWNIYYDFACLLAKHNKKEEAIEMLKKAIDNGYYSLEWIKRDKELDNIRNEEKFKSIIKEKFGGQNSG